MKITLGKLRKLIRESLWSDSPAGEVNPTVKKILNALLSNSAITNKTIWGREAFETAEKAMPGIDWNDKEHARWLEQAQKMWVDSRKTIKRNPSASIHWGGDGV